jgi:hypothetical protein
MHVSIYVEERERRRSRIVLNDLFLMSSVCNEGRFLEKKIIIFLW